MNWYQCHEDTVTMHVSIQPGAKQTDIVGLYGDTLKIRLHAPPIEGRANEALLKYIAQLFGVPVRNVIIKRGKQSRKKTLVIYNSVVNPEKILDSMPSDSGFR